MNANHDELVQLDEMLARSYEPVREPVAGQREAILAALSLAQPADRARPRRAWNGPLPWLATAACLAVAAAAVALLVPSSARLVYGIEAVPKRLAEVTTIRQRGYRMIYPREEANGPPIRVPIEYLVKRPDKFRLTTYGVSYPSDALMIVNRGIIVCDGSTESWISETHKTFVTRPIGLLDAWIKTETHAQNHLAELLGPPEVPYKKIGTETIGGRECDVYEGRFGSRSAFQDAFISKLWLDPATGYPVRSTQDEVLPDGSTRRVRELEEIAVDVSLDDKLFQMSAPEDYQTTTVAALGDATALDSQYTSAGYGGDKKLEFWHALRITDNAALVVWRRSKPEEKDDGTSDWLAGVTFSLLGDDRKRPVQHDWLYQSRSPDVWNWSLVAVADGPLPDRGGVCLELKTKPLVSRMEVIPLRFPERGLERIIEAAARATLPDDGPRLKLEHLRALAGQLLRNRPNP
ncbi:MAG: hypothetical protein WD063_19860 [Pirellulales bacterium]